ERQRVREDQLRAIALERERLSVTLHSIGEAVVATDNSSRVVTLNLAAEELTGWTQGEAMGRPICQVLRLVNERSGEPLEASNSARVAVQGDSGTLLVSRDGVTRPVSFTASAIRGSDGHVMGTVLVLRDVMQARRAERELEQGLRRFELLAETAGQLLQVREPKQSAYSLCARVMEHLDCQVFFNFLVDESTGRLHLHACAGISEQEARALEWLDCGAAICGCAAVEKTRIVAEYILESDDARADLVRAQGVRAYACHPLLGPGGRVLGTLSFGTKTRDAFGSDELSLMKAVTDQVAIAMVRQEDEQALRKSAEALREADHRKNEFLAVLSHELRNPLAPIMNGLHVLEQVAPGSEQARRAQRVIRRQVVQMARLVDDLLDVARITRNKVALQREMLELNQLLRRAIEDQRGLFDEAGLRLELESPTCCIFVEADATRITQIVSNLLQNAARFSRVGGRTVVSVLVKELDEAVEIRVTDDGVGIAEEIRPHLFQPFMQADTSLDRRKGGLGVGLSLAKALVELHGGEITVYSAGVDQGSQFTVRLPLRSVSWENDWRSSSSLPAARCVPRRVLVIEDNEDAADTLREALEFSENKVEVAYNGQDGIQKAKEFLPDVVFCDIGLPGMSGYEVAAELRRDDRFREAHLVALTGYALPEDRRRAAEAGFDDHLPKPSSVQAIQSLLSKLGAPGS
ncbi:MAG TPA: ATP-binding protein, partial [Polyangiaceae bacterium]|nr:ATP-binding protein [Polyangiaceae bacterium]